MALAKARTDDELAKDIEKAVAGLTADGVENITPELVAAELGCATDYKPSERLVDATKKALAALKKTKKGA